MLSSPRIMFSARTWQRTSLLSRSGVEGDSAAPSMAVSGVSGPEERTLPIELISFDVALPLEPTERELIAAEVALPVELVPGDGAGG